MTSLTGAEKEPGSSYLSIQDLSASFCKMIDASFTVNGAKGVYVQRNLEWMQGQTLRPGSRRNVLRTSVKRAMKWAAAGSYIDRSPLRHMRKPASGDRKEQVVTIAQCNAHTPDARRPKILKRPLSSHCQETGCRPQESLRVGQHVDCCRGSLGVPVSEDQGQEHHGSFTLTRVALGSATRLMRTN
jgi:hypothetical protein